MLAGTSKIIDCIWLGLRKISKNTSFHSGLFIPQRKINNRKSILIRDSFIEWLLKFIIAVS